MGEIRRPADWKYYPTCKHLDVLFSRSPETGSQRDYVVLPKDAEPICRQFEDFEPRKGVGGK